MSTDDFIQEYESALKLQAVADTAVKVLEMRAKLQSINFKRETENFDIDEDMLPEDREFCSKKYRSPDETLEYLGLDWTIGHFRKQLNTGKIPEARKIGRTWQVSTSWAHQEKWKRLAEQDNQGH